MIQIDVKSTALLVMDVQNDIVHPEGKYKDFGSPAHAGERRIFEHIAAVLEKARSCGMKVIYVKFGMRDFEKEVRGNHTPILEAVGKLKACDLNAWGGEIHDAVRPVEGEEIVEKNRVDSFQHTQLKKILDKGGITTLIMAGVATNYVVEATARHASDDDYRVIVLEDCCSSMNQEMHDFSIKNILPNLGLVTGSAEVMAAM